MAGVASGSVLCTLCCGGEAEGYCAECDEFFCQKCRESHDQIGAFQQHKMIKSGLQIFRKAQIDAGLQCDIHKKSVLSFYCPNHDAVACKTCKNTTHKSCNDVMELSSAARCIEKSPQFVDLTKYYENLIVSFIKSKDNFVEELICIQQQKTDLLQAVTDFRMYVIQRLDELQTHVQSEIECLVKSESQRITSQVQNCDTALPCLYAARNSLIRAEKQQEESIFINLKKAVRQKDRLDAMLKVIQEESYSFVWEFQSDEQLLGSLFSLGKVNTTVCQELPRRLKPRSLSVSSSSSRLSGGSSVSMNIVHKIPQQDAEEHIQDSPLLASSSTITQDDVDKVTHRTSIGTNPFEVDDDESVQLTALTDFKESKPEHEKPHSLKSNASSSSIASEPAEVEQSFSAQQGNWTVVTQDGTSSAVKHTVRSASDRRNCLITGLVFTETGSLLLVDKANANVKLFDVKCKPVSCLQLPSFPGDINYFGKQEAAALLPEDKVIRFISVGKTLAFTKQLKVPPKSRRFAKKGNTLVVGLDAEIQIIELSEKGETKKSQIGKIGKLFHDIQSIAISREGDRIFVADSATGVIGMSVQGEIIFTYKDIYRPRGLALGPEGFLIVSGYAAIFVMSEDGGEVHSVATSRHGCLKPTATGYSSRLGCFAHASWGMGDTDNIVTMYRMLPN